MTRNEIRFVCRRRGDAGALVIVPRIDGAPLTKLIDGFEIAAGMKPVGDAYGGLIPEFFRFGPMLDHFLGRSTNAMGPKTPVLGCECGEWGCWPLMVRITATADLVTWDAFEQPHRTTRDYTAFGPFHFRPPPMRRRLARSERDNQLRQQVSSPAPSHQVQQESPHGSGRQPHGRNRPER
ncbi:hypothetical protein [Streptomyces mirabilis]|uniref:hypothetical protein n=1 Tax=Streptomyces mirabilis TaxID=68239 RepID=UPI0033BD73F3